MRMVVAVAVLVGWTAATAAPKADSEGRALVIVVDRALTTEKLEVVATAVTESLATLPAGSHVAVVTAASNRTANVEAALQSAKNTKQLAAAMRRIRTTTVTDVRAGIRSATKLLAAAKTTHRHILVITDGDDMIDIDPVTRAVHDGGITMSALGYQSMNRITLKAIATHGNGELYLADSRADIGKALVAELTPIPACVGSAVVLVIDRSGSMQGAKLEAAKESARVTVEVLAPDDAIAVIAFDSEAQVLVRPSKAANRMKISSEISRLTSGGGTNFYPGLKEAYEMLTDSPEFANRVKHVILMSDGESPADGIADLVLLMHAAKITVSAVGVQGADRNLLSMIADIGDGRLYMVEDIGALPKIFLKETQSVKCAPRN